MPISPAELDEAYAVNAVIDLWRRNNELYGIRKMWHAMRRAGHRIGRDQVGRLMRIAGVQGVRRGDHRTVTTTRAQSTPRHPDLLKRDWSKPTKPDMWWVADFTYVWTLTGFVYVSFITDVYSRRILGWRVMSTKETALVSSAVEQALATRRRQDSEFTTTGLVHHSDAGSQYTSGVHRSPGRSGNRRLHRQCRRRSGQRADGVHDRLVQDRIDRASPAPDSLAEQSRGRGGSRRVGPVVQHREGPFLDRLQ